MRPTGRAAPPAEAGLEVRVTVWDGAHEPVQVRERGTVGRRAALARAVAERVAAIAGAGAPGKPLPPPQLAARLVEQAAALDAENIGGEWGASAAWLNRWWQAHRLLDLARFVAPDDRTAALGWVRSRFREDLAKSAGASAGTKYYDEPEHLWQVRRADAWGRFVDRFGLGGDWPHLWPQRPNIADNRTATNTVASMYLRSAVEVLGAIPNSDWDRGRSHWPISGKPLAALLDAWTQETLRRALIVADAKLAPAGALATEAAELRRVLRHDDKAMDLLNARLPSPPVTVMPPTPATARATAPQPARVATTAGAKTVGATAAGAATRAPAQPKNSPAVRASAGIDLTDRYHVSVAAVAAWQDAWLVAANGQDLGTANLDMGNFLFLRTAKDGDKFRRIEKSLNLQAGVAAVAQQGPVVWIAGSGDGIVQIDLATVKWKRWGLKSGLPVETFADIDMDRNRGPVAVSGESVSPPVIALRQNEQWTGHTVETFRTNPQEKPYGKRVAATRGAVLVSGDEHGAAPFASLWPRDKQRWMDVRTPLLRHLEENKLDVRGVPFGKERFNVLDAVALPAGGFVLLHSLGASWITDAGALLRTTPWPERRRAAEIGQALLSQDASRLWIAANAEPGAGVVIELPLSAGVPPTFHALPGVSRPLRLAQNEDQLLVGGVSSGPHVIFLRLRDGSIER